MSLLVYHFLQCSIGLLYSPLELFCSWNLPNHCVNSQDTDFIYLVIMFIVNILKIIVPRCSSPKAFLSNRGTTNNNGADNTSSCFVRNFKALASLSL